MSLILVAMSTAEHHPAISVQADLRSRLSPVGAAVAKIELEPNGEVRNG